ncbi:MAG TPA: tetratricopeptide repeat protein [Pyrinomonadaceae bacterium]|nr:tetratricopeptide repeat protein [Pyrinomonadaceae bacterium]
MYKARQISLIRIGFNFLLAFICALIVVRNGAAADAQWVSVRSSNFSLVGHLSEREAQTLVGQLEEFRAVFRQILPEKYFDSLPPGVIVVFANDGEYAPFKPVHEGRVDQYVAGYFRPGGDLNYLTLAARGSQEETRSVLFHEYVHALVRNGQARAPLWFNEGLAEYYSAYELSGGGRCVRFGGPLLGRAQYLRNHPLLPLATLLEADRFSPLYHEHDGRQIFYAQSWALVHYLLSDPSGERARQLSKFLALIEKDVPAIEASKLAFGIEAATLERRLAAYVRGNRYPARTLTLDQPPPPFAATETRALSAAEAQAQLGDLLLRTDRYDEAREYLQRALKLDANLAPARISLALLYLREGRTAEAKEELRLAVAAAPANHLAHYYYSDLLRRDCSDVENTPAGFITRTNQIKAQIKRAIELAPDFADAYGLLVLTDIERSPQLDEAAEVLGRLLRLAPGRREWQLLRAGLQLRREEFAAARTSLQTLIEDPQINESLRHAARESLDVLAVKEKLAADRILADSDAAVPVTSPEGDWQPCDMPEPGPQFKAQRFAGRQSCGRLEKVECVGEGVILYVKAGARTLRLHTATLSGVRFVSFTKTVGGRIECGARSNPDPVLVTYRAVAANADEGELKAVEFVPEDWLH